MAQAPLRLPHLAARQWGFPHAWEQPQDTRQARLLHQEPRWPPAEGLASGVQVAAPAGAGWREPWLQAPASALTAAAAALQAQSQPGWQRWGLLRRLVQR